MSKENFSDEEYIFDIMMKTVNKMSNEDKQRFIQLLKCKRSKNEQ